MGINYWETYTPVVNWVSVRFLLIISQLAGLETRALDFILPFPQAKLDVPVYMKIPPGIDIEKHKDQPWTHESHGAQALSSGSHTSWRLTA